MSNDIFRTFDFGYDPTLPEPIETVRVPSVEPLPARAGVDERFLPPVGRQSVPACASWSSTYGLATFTAARKGGYSPTDPARQASPAYIYIQVMKGDKVGNDTCHGSQFKSYFHILAEGGTPSVATAPLEHGCTALWEAYGSGTLPADAHFTIGAVTSVGIKESLDDMKAVLASGRALVYGTQLYTDFPTYHGDPDPYVGNGVILKNHRTQKPAGHCMLIVGYDDDQGAVRIQNSFGPEWGTEGFVSMAYDTFQTLAQGVAIFVAESSSTA
jgi:hypothetical protein